MQDLQTSRGKFCSAQQPRIDAAWKFVKEQRGARRKVAAASFCPPRVWLAGRQCLGLSGVCVYPSRAVCVTRHKHACWPVMEQPPVR